MGVQLYGQNPLIHVVDETSVIDGKLQLMNSTHALSVVDDIKLAISDKKLNDALKQFNEIDVSHFTKLRTADLTDMSYRLVEYVTVLNQMKQNVPLIPKIEMDELTKALEKLNEIFNDKIVTKEAHFFNTPTNQSKIIELKNCLSTLIESLDKAHTLENIETVLKVLKISVGILETISGGGITPIIREGVHLLHPIPVS